VRLSARVIVNKNGVDPLLVPSGLIALVAEIPKVGTAGAESSLPIVPTAEAVPMNDDELEFDRLTITRLRDGNACSAESDRDVFFLTRAS